MSLAQAFRREPDEFGRFQGGSSAASVRFCA